MDDTESAYILAQLGLNDEYTGIEHRLVHFDVPLPEQSSVNLSGTFLYFTFKGKSPSVEEFTDFIYPKIVPFCVPRRKREKLIQKFIETQDPKYALELTDQAKNLFIKAKKTLKRGGEPGELILFAVLEHYLKAPQIASKMFLKTSESMPVHGTDGIHIKYDPESARLFLFWGESKLYQKLSTSLDEICSSIGDFVNYQQGRTARDRDIDILKDHISIEDEQTKAALLEYFDPYSAKSNELREVYSCFSGFDYSLYENLNEISEDEVEEYFKSKYSERIVSAHDLFIEKVLATGMSELAFQFILLPFRSVEEFRALFFAKLGIEMYEIEEGGSDD